MLSLIHDESGATVIEYGLLAGLIAVVAIFGVHQLGGNVAALFNAPPSTSSFGQGRWF